MIKMKWFIGIVIAILFVACGEYNKVLKSTDLKYKYEMAVQYYEAEQYYKAVPLFEELLIIYRGTGKAEKLQYYSAYCDYNLGDYIVASHRFKSFSQTYPKSEHAEECRFMSAVCYYNNSPEYSLDQTNTYRAMKELQLFVNMYPASTKVDSCNTLMDQLRVKLETKYFEISKQSLHMQQYKTAIVNFQNLLKDYPDTDYREEASFLLLKSRYELATRSISAKKSQRFDETIDSYVKFVDSFAQSKYIKDAESMYNASKKEKEKISKQTI